MFHEYLRGMGIEKLDVIEKFNAANGLLNILHFQNLPFKPVRLYWLSGVDSGHSRGGHAHKELSQLFIVVSGSLRLSLWDGSETIEFNLDSGCAPIHVQPGYWRDIDNFSAGAVLLVLADQEFRESDYLRDENEFLRWKQSS